jgi:hypothetical protein
MEIGVNILENRHLGKPSPHHQAVNLANPLNNKNTFQQILIKKL